MRLDGYTALLRFGPTSGDHIDCLSLPCYHVVLPMSESSSNSLTHQLLYPARPEASHGGGHKPLIVTSWNTPDVMLLA